MNLPVNEGQHPSRLELDRLHTGELTDAEAEALRARVGDREQAHLDAVEAARGQVRPFDAAAIRAHPRRGRLGNAGGWLPGPGHRPGCTGQPDGPRCVGHRTSSGGRIVKFPNKDSNNIIGSADTIMRMRSVSPL